MHRRWVAPQWGPPQRWELERFIPAEPGPHEVTILIRAAGVNPADAKHVAVARPGVAWPVQVGYEVSGELSALGAQAEAAGFQVGDEVIAFRVSGGYASAVTVPLEKVLRKPAALSHAEAANLLLAGTTAAEMLDVVRAVPGETLLLHGASGAVGVSVLQQARLRGILAIGTVGAQREDVVRGFGGIPVRYGPGLTERVSAELERRGVQTVAAALDAVGTEEAIDVSTRLVADRQRIVTIVRPDRAVELGFRAIAGSLPDSAVFRDRVRADLVQLAARGLLQVPVAATYPLEHAREALALLAQGHPGGKLALIP